MKLTSIFRKLGRVKKQHTRIALAIAALTLFVLGAGAPGAFDN